jgi:hypothetical protein
MEAEDAARAAIAGRFGLVRSAFAVFVRRKLPKVGTISPHHGCCKEPGKLMSKTGDFRTEREKEIW